jgi:hypothetical protein
MGPQETRACANAVPPPDETILTTEKTLTLGSKSETREHWGSVEIGQADRRSSEPGGFIHQLR